MNVPVPRHFLEPLDRPRIERILQAAAEERVGTRLGPYRLLRCVAIGGMGTVYLAERDDGAYRQRVAVKVSNLARPPESLRAQLQQERQILAELQHPDVARLLDAGETEDERPWFAMEWIDGEPLTEHCRERGLSRRERLRLLARVARAVDAAHRSLVVHRDLKPSNVLVTPDGEPRVIDFGISAVTKREGDRLSPSVPDPSGTPGYVAPEQRRGEAVTTASDVYSLGVLLRELLADGPVPPADLQQLVRSTTAESVLDRMGSARELAEELERWIDGRPLEVCGKAPWYRCRRFLRRHAVGTAVLLLLVSGLAGTASLARDGRRRAEQAERSALEQAAEARTQAQRANTALGFLRSLLRSGDLDDGGDGDLRVHELLDRWSDALGGEHELDRRTRLTLHDTLASSYYSLGRPIEAERELRAALLLAESDGELSTSDRAGLWTGLAATLADQHRLEEAREAAEHALDLGVDDPGARACERTCLANLAMVLLHCGDAESAEHLLQQAMKRIPAEGEPSTDPPVSAQEAALLAHNLAETLRTLGRLDEAEEWTLTALAKRDQLPPSLVASTLNNLGTLRNERGDDVGALKAWEESYTILRADQGGRLPATGYAANNLAIALQDAGRLDEAEARTAEAVEILESSLGDAHPIVARTLRNRAALLRRLARIDEARATMEHALAVLERSPEPDAAEIERFRSELATLDPIPEPSVPGDGSAP